MNERDVQHSIHLALGQRDDVVLWRNTTGSGIIVDTGALRRIQAMAPASPQARAIERLLTTARFVRYGLCVGSSDLIGIQAVEVTPELVGSRIGRFVALEIKADRGRPSETQKRFLELVQRLGGAAGVTRTVESAEAVLGTFHVKPTNG